MLLSEGLLACHDVFRIRTRRLAERLTKPPQGLAWAACRLSQWLALADSAMPLCGDTYLLACHVVQALSTNPGPIPQVRGG